MDKRIQFAAPVRPTQEFPPRGCCVFSRCTAIPYDWCGAPTGSLDKPWCPAHEAVVFLPAKDKGAAD